jgi:hypothetical protein
MPKNSTNRLLHDLVSYSKICREVTALCGDWFHPHSGSRSKIGESATCFESTPIVAILLFEERRRRRRGRRQKSENPEKNMLITSAWMKKKIPEEWGNHFLLYGATVSR